MYFAIAYDIWPHLTGRALDSLGLMRAQLWTWFVGMIVLTFPWHCVGILGMPRRMAFYDYTEPAHRGARRSRSIDVGGWRRSSWWSPGVLFLLVLVRGQRAPRRRAGRLSLQRRVHPPRTRAGGAERLRALGWR